MWGMMWIYAAFILSLTEARSRETGLNIHRFYLDDSVSQKWQLLYYCYNASKKKDYFTLYMLLEQLQS